jgi:tetratricopeptide (TPR) repeat protein
MSKRAWKDVAGGAGVLVALQLVWMLLVYTGVSGALASTPLMIGWLVVNLIALGIAAALATRSLDDHRRIWRRLTPIAFVPAALSLIWHPSMREWNPPVRGELFEVSGMLLICFGTYAAMWAAAWFIRRGDPWPPAERPPVRPLWARPGVRIWAGILIVALGMQITASLAARRAQALAEELYPRIVEQMQAGDLDGALETARRLTRLQPEYYYGWWSLGGVQYKRGEYAEAAESYRKAIDLSAGHHAGELHQNLGGALFQLGDWPAAGEHYQKALEADPDDAGTHYDYAQLLRAYGYSEEATEHLRRTVEEDPEYLKARITLGAELSRTGGSDEAIEHLRRAVELAPENADAHAYLSMALSQVGEFDAAVEHARTAHDLDPRTALPLIALGRIYRTQGDLDRALDTFRAAMALDPTSHRPLANLVTTLLGAGRVDEALNAVRTDGQKFAAKNREWLRATEAMVLIFAGETAQADRLLGEMDGSRAQGRHMYVATRVALSHAYLGETERAAEIAQETLDAVPTAYYARSALGLAQALSGDREAALETLVRLRELGQTPEDTARAVMAYAFASRGDTIEARSQLAQISDMLSGLDAMPEHLYLAGLAYRELGETERANELFQLASDRWPKHPWSVEMREMMQ